MIKTSQQRQHRQMKTPQYGGRILVYQGASLQRGHGLGGLFKSIFCVAVPVLRRAAPIVKHAAVCAGKSTSKHAFKAGKKALKDVVTKKATLKEAIKDRAQEAALAAAFEAINKSETSRKVNTSARQTKKKERKRRKTIAPRL